MKTPKTPPISNDRFIAYCFLTPAALILVVFALYPALNTIYLSFFRIILTMPDLGEKFVGLENYRTLVGDPSVFSSYLLTWIFVIVSTLFELALGLMLALVINQRFFGRGALRAVALIPWAVPTVVASQMWRFIFNDQYGFANFLLYGADTSAYTAWLAEPFTAFCAIVFADIWKTSSFAGLLILAGLQMIPEELYEAAKVDGANRFTRFRHITLPLIKPAILIALLFRTMDAFRVFDLVFVMTQGGPADATGVIQFYGYKKIFSQGDLGYGCAVSTLVFVSILLISIFYIRSIGSGLLKHSED